MSPEGAQEGRVQFWFVKWSFMMINTWWLTQFQHQIIIIKRKKRNLIRTWSINNLCETFWRMFHFSELKFIFALIYIYTRTHAHTHARAFPHRRRRRYGKRTFRRKVLHQLCFWMSRVNCAAHEGLFPEIVLCCAWLRLSLPLQIPYLSLTKNAALTPSALLRERI